MTDDGDLLAKLGTDAEKWARAFDEYEIATDFQSMVPWFANAIEAGRSAGYVDGRESERTRSEKLIERLRTCRILQCWIKKWTVVEDAIQEYETLK